jgi:hypothetical protein
MRRWYEQKKPLYPQPIQWRKGTLLCIGLAAWMFYIAADNWLNGGDSCSGRRCGLVNLLAELAGVSRNVAEAQYFAALGLMMLVIAYQIWRHR